MSYYDIFVIMTTSLKSAETNSGLFRIDHIDSCVRLCVTVRAEPPGPAPWLMTYILMVHIVMAYMVKACIAMACICHNWLMTLPRCLTHAAPQNRALDPDPRAQNSEPNPPEP